MRKNHGLSETLGGTCVHLPCVHFNKIQLFEFLFIRPAASCNQDFLCLRLGQVTETLVERVSCSYLWRLPRHPPFLICQERPVEGGKGKVRELEGAAGPRGRGTKVLLRVHLPAVEKCDFSWEPGPEHKGNGWRIKKSSMDWQTEFSFPLNFF